MSDHILSLSTEVEPAKKFTIDEEEYLLKGFEHLSDEDEATVTAKFTRFMQILGQLERAKNDQTAERLATVLRTRRVELITLLTNVPREVADKLPPGAQAQLFRQIQRETGLTADVDEDVDDLGVD